MPNLGPAQPVVEHFYRGSCLGCLNGSYATDPSPEEYLMDFTTFSSLVSTRSSTFIYLFIYDYWAVSTAGVPRKKKGITVLGIQLYTN